MIVGIFAVALILGLAIGSGIIYPTTTVTTTAYYKSNVIASSPSGCVVGTSGSFCQSWAYLESFSSNYVVTNCRQYGPSGPEFCNTTTLYFSSSNVSSYVALTVTVQTVLVILYTPTCTTVSGRTTSEYLEAFPAETTNVTTIYPTIPSNSHLISLTTVTNNTVTNSNRTQTESTFSC